VISAVGHEVDFTIADFVADLRAPTPSAAAELVVPVREELRMQVEERRGVLMSRLSWWLDRAGERWEHLRARLTSPEAALAQQRERLEELRSRISLATGNRGERNQERLRQVSTRLQMVRPDRFNEFRRGLLTELEGRLNTAASGGLERAAARLTRDMGLLDSLSPLVVMGRGYASVTTPTGEAVRSVRGLHPGDALQVRLRDGKLMTEVKEVREED
jgi:exodeoxyribonuclease VII large subunit